MGAIWFKVFFVSNNIFVDAMYAIAYLVLGFLSASQTDWCVRLGQALLRKYPNAFSSRLAERSWYPTLLRVGGCFCLIIGGWHAVRVTLAFLPR